MTPPLSHLVPEPAAAMSSKTVALNRLYVELTSQRGLKAPTHVACWRGQLVDVFLRHESDHVFAIATHEQIGMANVVALTDVSFHVDEAGRRQACRGEGQLPNGRNVHAWVRGMLSWAGMQNPFAVTQDWTQVVYNPHSMSSFQSADNDQSVRNVAAVACTPAPARVWSIPESHLSCLGGSV